MTLEELGRRIAWLRAGGLAKVIRAPMVGLALEGERRGKLNATTRLRVRSGRLRASITGKVRDVNGMPEIVLSAGGRTGGADVGYARMLEFGGIQRPRNAKMLRIPLPAALTAAGVDRYPSPLRITGAGEFVLRKSKAGKLLLHKLNPDGSLGPPWYVLAANSTIPAHPYLGPALESLIPDLAPRVLEPIQAYLTAEGGEA